MKMIHKTQRIIPSARTLRDNISVHLPTKSIHFLANFYQKVMNQSDFLSIDESRIVNHLIPSKGERKLIVNADLTSQLHTGTDLLLMDDYGNGEPEISISLHLQHCKQYMQKLLVFKSDISLCDNGSRYRFFNMNAEITIPKLSCDDRDNMTHDLDLQDAVFIDYFDVNGSDIPPADYFISVENVLKHFSPSLPIQILIAEDKIIGFEQNGHIINSYYTTMSDDPIIASISNATTILTSFNFHHIRGSQVGKTFTRVLKTHDAQYWLSTNYELLLAKSSDTLAVSVFEHLKQVR
jgi:hypothetical protein